MADETTQGQATTTTTTSTDSDAELDQLRAIAQRRGLVVEDGHVAPKERIDFRSHKRQAREQLAAKEREHAERIAAHKEQLEFAEQVTRLVSDEDFDGLAKLLKYEGGWDDIQRAHAARQSDPNYGRLKQLERQMKERQAADERDAAYRKEAEAKAASDAARQGYMVELQKSCAESQDRLVRTLAKDPEFLQVLYAIQLEHYDPATQTTVTPEKALEMISPRRKTAFRTRLRELRDLLSEAFAEDSEQTETPDTSGVQAAKPKEPAKKKPLASRTGPTPTPSVTAPKPPGKMTPAEWNEYKRLKLATAKDEATS